MHMGVLIVMPRLPKPNAISSFIFIKKSHLSFLFHILMVINEIQGVQQSVLSIKIRKIFIHQKCEIIKFPPKISVLIFIFNQVCNNVISYV